MVRRFQGAIGQAAAAGLSQCLCRALRVGRFTKVPTECNFPDVLVKVLAADGVPRAHHAALHQRVERLAVLHMHDAADVFFGVVVDRLVTTEALDRLGEVRAAVGENLRRLRDVLLEGCADRLVVHVGHSDGLHAVVSARDERHHRGLDGDGRALVRVLGPAADVRFVNLNHAVELCEVAVLQRVADAVVHVPRRLVTDAQHATHLHRGQALFRRTEQADCNDPLVEPDLAVFKDGADGHGELVTAITALIQTGAALRAHKFRRVVHDAAVSADRTRRPQHAFQVRARSVSGGEPLHEVD